MMWRLSVNSCDTVRRQLDIEVMSPYVVAGLEGLLREACSVVEACILYEYLPHEGPVAQAHAFAGTPGQTGASRHLEGSRVTVREAALRPTVASSFRQRCRWLLKRPESESWKRLSSKFNTFLCTISAHPTLLSRCILKSVAGKNAAGWGCSCFFFCQSFIRYLFKLRAGPPLCKGSDLDAVDWKIQADLCKAKVGCRQPA